MKFTLAHELGHYLNDKDYLDDNGEMKDGSKQSPRWLHRKEKSFKNDKDMRRRDVKANKFAADLLMPKDVFIEKWQELSTPQKVAEYFGVSLEATHIRASSLLGEIV